MPKKRMPKLTRPDAKIIWKTLETHGIIPVNLLPPFYFRGLEELQEKGIATVSKGNIYFSDEVPNPGDIHIDIASHNNPPKWQYKDRMGNIVVGEMIDYKDYGGTDVTYFFKREDGTIDVLSGSRLKEAKVIYPKNPPIPFSSVMELGTASSIFREIDQGDRRIADLKQGRKLLDTGIRKVIDSHKGNLDMDNPPMKKHLSERAKQLGLHLETYSPGDAVTRYRFFTKVQDYHSGDGIYTALGRKEAEIFLAGYAACKYNPGYFDYRKNPPAKQLIYSDVIEIKAKKPDGRLYKHSFGKGSRIFGNPDGSLSIVSSKGKKLWKMFPKGDK